MTHGRPRVRFTLALTIVALLLVFFTYSGAYCLLRNRGLEDARIFDIEGFFYVPIHANVTSEDMIRHMHLAALFEPAHWIDRNLFGGPSPSAVPMDALR